MGWFEKILSSIVSLLMFSDTKTKPVGNAYAPAGPDALSEEKAIVAEQAKKVEAKKEARKSDQKQKLVVDGAKLQCKLCSNQQGLLKVTYDTPSIQGKLAATVKDKGKPNLLFAGTCSKSFNSSSACASVIQLDKWQNTGSLKIQNESPLLYKSTIKCLYGGVDIKITDSGQRNNFAYDLPTQVEEDIEEKVSIAISVFFDGTGNNKNNTEARLEYDKKMRHKPYNDKVWPYDATKASYYEASSNKTNDSYENDLSNVARLFKYYEEDTTHATNRRGSVYVEGIGTLDYKSDDIFPGAALGEGKTGILAKVERGCKQAAEKINSINLKGKKIPKLTIDVFGFSRGAAAARNFIYEINKPGKPAYTCYYNTGYGVTGSYEVAAEPANGALGKYMQKYGIEFEILEIRFAGLFDTVSSHGTNKSNDVTDLHLTAVSLSKSSLHLVAADEHRENFPLIQIQSAGIKGVTKYLPGAHSDIGGCYVDNATEYVDELVVGDEDKLKAGKKQLIEQGWYLHSELEVHNVVGKLSGTRNLSNMYSFIALHVMRNHASQKPVYLRFKEDFKTKFEIKGDFLNKVSTRLNSATALEFYTRDELDRQIKVARPDFKPKTFDTTPMRSGSQGYSTSVSPRIQPTIRMPMNAEEFNDHPVLKQRIEDHYMLVELRNKYLHWSANYDGIGMDPSIQSGKRRRVNYPG
ncbi:PAAR-like protein [Cytophaga aurantiaca]|uniref:PAAR-like protein n=1 Tax=Cytophaga aurantiaca TaxID=29530 RepID=UPI000381B8C1|nr:PAAR-like protein [Cytophaga aurantiaca]